MGSKCFSYAVSISLPGRQAWGGRQKERRGAELRFGCSYSLLATGLALNRRVPVFQDGLTAPEAKQVQIWLVPGWKTSWDPTVHHFELHQKRKVGYKCM